MGRADLISGAFWFVFSAFSGYLSYKLGLGTLYQPGPGFFFFWTAIFVAVLSVAILVRGFKIEAGEGEKEPIIRKVNIVKVVLVLAALFCYAMLVERIGYVILTFLLFVFLLAVIEKKRWTVSVFVGLVVTVLSYLLFETALQSQLPKGLLEFFRF
jgi:putative tricarboxylic transport membrane protein